VNENIERGVREKRSFANEFRVTLPNGAIKHVEAINNPIFSAGGELLEIVVTGVEVTERKRAAQALRESEQSLRSAIDGIAGLVGILAPNGEVETVNRQVMEYFGRSLEWIKNWGTNDAVHPEDLPGVLEVLKRGMAYGTPFNQEFRIRRFDGEYRWFEIRAVPVRDDSGSLVRWYVLLVDIEDRTRALAQLNQMQAGFAHINRVSVMGELAASLSHEIAQPIASARNNVRAARNFLNMQPPNLVEVGEALDGAVGDTERAGRILDRIRDHIKNAPPRKEHFDINSAIEEIIVLAQTAISKNGVSVQTRFAETLLSVHGDRVQLQQVILNLLLNAVEAMGSCEAGARELLIGSEQNHRGVLIAVLDSGPGIWPAPGSEDTELGVLMELEVCHGTTEVYAGVQA
jgi:PAS domain S-box-containing protein